MSLKENLTYSLKPFGTDQNDFDSDSDVNEVLEDILDYLSEEFVSIDVERYYDQHMDQLAVNENYLKLIFGSIILNAAEAITTGQTSGRIKIYTETQEKEVIIRIYDNGIGMSEGTLKNIFNPFFTTKSKINKTGLGLTFTDSIIQEIKGAITVKSQKGSGTEFVIAIPKDQNHEIPC